MSSDRNDPSSSATSEPTDQVADVGFWLAGSVTLLAWTAFSLLLTSA